MSGSYIGTIIRAGDEGVELSMNSLAVLERELNMSGWRLVHDIPGILVVWVNHEALYCHIAWDASATPVAWTSH